MTYLSLCDLIGCDPETFAKTLSDWNGYVAAKNDPDFGRATGMEEDLSVPPYYAIKIAPGIHHTMGGVKIDTLTQVIDTDGNVIPNLYACGEVTASAATRWRISWSSAASRDSRLRKTRSKAACPRKRLKACF